MKDKEEKGREVGVDNFSKGQRKRRSRSHSHCERIERVIERKCPGYSRKHSKESIDHQCPSLQLSVQCNQCQSRFCRLLKRKKVHQQVVVAVDIRIEVE